MKKSIHPQLHSDALTTCMSCGSKFAIPSTVKVQQVEVCSSCHPLYTGEFRGARSTEGRVDRFRKIQAESKKKQEADAAKPPKKTRVKKS